WLLQQQVVTITMWKQVPSLTLGSNGVKIPMLGLGTWKSKPGEVAAAVASALACGYRHIDAAFLYGNEKEVGQGIKEKIADGTVKREEIFVTSKLWNCFHSTNQVLVNLKKSLENLGLEYLDLYLIHWPTGFQENGLDGVYYPKDASGKTLYSNIDYLETWTMMEKAQEMGLVKAIGVSNFNKSQLERLLAVARIPPVNNQFESHPYLINKKLIQFCQSKNVSVTAYSPLGSPDRPWAKPSDPQLTEEPKIKAIANKYGKTPAQVIIRFQIQRNVIVIPKSVTKSRIEENINIWDFKLNDGDMSTIESFDCHGRVCHSSEVSDHPLYPFNDEY
ncbi:unnamed protein product, partial [Meganyctiphanes norvegica]